MSASSDSNKVVDLQQRQAANLQHPDRGGELIRQCRSLAQKHLGSLVSALFDNVDDALFDLAEKAESNTGQIKYFDGMREVRKKRQLIERAFQENLAREFLNLGSQRTVVVEAASESTTLSLIEEQDLEESLAISAMVGKTENRLSRQIFALDQRMSVLQGGSKIDSSNNPLAPAAFCRAFHKAASDLQVDLHVKLMILKLFDKHVMGGIEALYEEVSLLLVQSGVLPQLKQTLPTRKPGSAPSPTAEPHPIETVAQVGSPSLVQQAAAAEAELQLELYSTVRNLLASRRAGLYSGPSGPPMPAFATNEVLNALSVLQNQATGLAPHAGYLASMQMLPVAQIKDELVGQLRRLGSSDEKHQMAAADEDTIDLVGMLFEYILQDRNLPAEIQALLARMQIPYLKCAILDKALFAKKEHPARQLLDELAHAGLSWSEASDKDGRFYEKVKSVVETLLKDFDDDVEIFNRLLADFRDFQGSTRKRAEVAELRAAEAARGRERLQGARKTAAREILSRIEGQKLPEVIRHILTRPWANVLVLTILRQGEGSHPWKTSLRVADELVWVAQPKQTDAERARLRALLPELEKALRQGLAMVAYHDNDVRQLLADLSRFCEIQVDPEAQARHEAAAASAADQAAEAGAGAESERGDGEEADGDGAGEDSFVEEMARQPESDSGEVDPESRIEDQHYQVARAMKVGTWIEFRIPEQRAERAKLSWISPISSKYLFVNRKGLKVADKTVWALATEMRAGRAILLEDVPLFDRALDAIVERLKGTVQGEGQGNGDDQATNAPSASG